ncbi:phage tail tape measure protein [Methylosinus sp. Sm6]|uniref:phage tail tape measure protein n=1 Tax=Methylosinus sp. Sm6 TaxID=2866948 RepID=UPI001C9A2B33|nr:phage tail tape measure protein [Methylosinus sp. Sm6]MBY6243731.1 phage tail tape measure protein [Methylosinus sp. Sm6]
MTDLDVAVRLRLVNLLSKEAKVAAKDIAGVGAAAGKLDGKGTGRFAGELGKAWTASAKLGGSLERTAAAAGKIDGKAASRVAEALGKASSASDKLGASLGKTGVAAEKIGGKAAGRFAGELGKAWTASAKLGGSLEKTATAANKAAQGVAKIGQGSAAIDSTRRRIDQLTKSNIALGMSQRRLVSANMIAGMSRSGGIGGMAAAGAAGVALGRHGRGKRQEALREAASHITPNAYLIGAGGATVAGAAIGGTAAAGVAGAALAVRESVKFEKAMADVKKKVTLDEGATWADVERTINAVSREMGMARGDTAALTAMAGQAGIDYKDLAGFMMLAAKAAVGWDIAPKDASERLAKIKAQTQWTIPQLEEFADKVNALGDSSASAEKDIVEMFQRSAGAAKAAGVPLDTSLAVTTALNSIGMAEEVSARFWNAFSSKLRTASDQPDKAAEGYKLLGLTVQQVESGMKADATKMIIDVLERLEQSADKARAAVKIFGQEWWDEAARSGQALPEIRKNLEQIDSGKWKGSLQRNLQIDLATTDNHLKRTGALVSEIGDRLGRWALPPINKGLELFIRAEERLDEIERRRVETRAILDKGVNDRLTPREVDRLASDRELLGRAQRERAVERQALDAARGERKSLAQRIERTRAAGSKSGVDYLTPLYDRMRALDKHIGEMERRVEPAKAKADDAPRERHEGLRGAPGAADPAKVEELKAKFLQLDRLMKGMRLFPGSEEARQQAQKLVEELAGVFQRGDLGPAAQKLIDTYVAAIAAQSGKVDAEAQAIRARLQDILGAPIVVKIEPRLSGAPAVGGGAGGGTGGGAPAAPAAPKKKTSALPGGAVHIREAHFHGVKDLAGLHRAVMATADRRARAARDDALHDIDVG